jgi:hypothetical protein
LQSKVCNVDSALNLNRKGKPQKGQRGRGASMSMRLTVESESLINGKSGRAWGNWRRIETVRIFAAANVLFAELVRPLSMLTNFTRLCRNLPTSRVHASGRKRSAPYNSSPPGIDGSALTS